MNKPQEEGSPPSGTGLIHRKEPKRGFLIKDRSFQRYEAISVVRTLSHL